MACSNILTDDILRLCTDKNVGGIEIDLLLANVSDIDRSLTTISATNELIITDFKLKPGKKGFLLQGVKQVNALKFELVPKELNEDMFKHTLAGVIPNTSAENKLRLLELSRGEVVAIVETKFKGDLNKDAFQVGGFYSGLKLSTGTYASNENDGSITIELTSKEGYEEPTPTMTILETDYATTLTAFQAKFEETP